VSDQPLVSIQIITYNQIDFIHETLTSALEQDYENLEVVVADDGSTDGTAEVILEYAEKYPDIIVPLVGGPNLGITGNSNRGLRACRGNYIAFQGGDDVLLPGKISAQVAWMEEDEGRVICYHDVEVFDSSSDKKIYDWFEKVKPRQGESVELLKHMAFMCACSVMVRITPITSKIIFNASVPVSSDWLYEFEVAEESAGSIGYLPAVYARYRRHDSNVTSVGVHFIADWNATLAVLSEQYGYPFWVGQLKGVVYLQYAASLIRKKSYKQSLMALMKSVVSTKGIWFLPFLFLVEKMGL